MSKIVSGRQDELPDPVKNELPADADAELTGAELLADIVQNRAERIASPALGGLRYATVWL
jgi:hypothetical protein